MYKVLIATLLMVPAIASAASNATFEIKDFTYEFVGGTGSVSSDWRSTSATYTAIANASTDTFSPEGPGWPDGYVFSVEALESDASAELVSIYNNSYFNRYLGATGSVFAENGGYAEVSASYISNLQGTGGSLANPNPLRISATLNLSGTVDDPLVDLYTFNLNLTVIQFDASSTIFTNYALDATDFVNGIDQQFSFDLDVSNTESLVYFFDWSLKATNVTAVPEPSSYAMLGFGLGVLGFAAARRKRRNN